jgi:hypothetical protein
MWAEGFDRATDDGNCREIALELVAALAFAGQDKGWMIVEGEVNCSSVNNPRVTHCWVEYGDWVVDLSNGRAMICDRDIFYNAPANKVSRLRRMTLRQFFRKVS